MENALTKFRVIAQRRCVGRQQVLQGLACFMPDWTAKRKKGVQRVLREKMRTLGQIEIGFLFENGKIDNVLADRHTDTGRAIMRFENPEGKVLQREMRIWRDVDEATQRRTH